MAGEAPAKGIVKSPFAERLPRLRPLFGERGTAVVEFALVAPILFMIIFGIFDFGRALNYFNQESQLAGLAARSAAVNRCPDGTSVTSNTACIQQQISNPYATGQLRDNISVCIDTKAAIGDPVTVTTHYSFQFLPLVAAALGLGGTSTIDITASQSERQEAPAGYDTGDGGVSGGPGC